MVAVALPWSGEKMQQLGMHTVVIQTIQYKLDISCLTIIHMEIWHPVGAPFG